MSWLQSSCLGYSYHGVSFFQLVGVSLSTRHRISISILISISKPVINISQNIVQNIMYSPGEGTEGPWLCLLTKLLLFDLFDCSSLLLRFLNSPIKLALWLKVCFFPFIFISCRLITLQYCSGFCHTLTWISHGVTCISHPDPPSHLPLYPIPLGLPVHQAWALVSCIQPGLVICFTLDNIRFDAVLSKHHTLVFSHRVFG